MHVTGIGEYGIDFEELLRGRIAPPAQGARFDISYEGAIEGARLKGYIRGVDYMEVRADGRFQLNIYAAITTDDGVRIALTSDALLIAPDPNTGLAPVRLNMRFSTASPAYRWVNALLAWGTGNVNMQTREISVSVYTA
jgi:hypothetical protein